MPTRNPIRSKLITACSILFCVLVLPLSSQAESPNKKQPPEEAAKSGWSAPIRFFQKTLSKADGSRCAMNPTCSRYALGAFNKHDFLTAWMLTSDRLLRCGHDEIRLAPRVYVHGTVKAHDPLSANTFWWDKP